MATHEEEVPESQEEQEGGEQPVEPEELPEGYISREDLPEDLRDLPRDQIPNVINTVVDTLRARNAELEELRSRMMEGGQRGEPDPEPETDLPDYDEEELKDLILEDPEAAIDYYVQKRYGDRFQKLERMANQGVQESAFSRASQELSEFDDLEKEVRQVLDNGRVPATFENVRSAYYMVKGAKEEERDSKRKKKRVTTSEPPSPPKKEEAGGDLTAREKTMARAMGMSEEQYLKFKDMDGPMEMKVPMGGN